MVVLTMMGNQLRGNTRFLILYPVFVAISRGVYSLTRTVSHRREKACHMAAIVEGYSVHCILVLDSV